MERSGTKIIKHEIIAEILEDGKPELNQFFRPLRLINFLSGHHCRDYRSEKKRQTHLLGSRELVVSIDDVAVPSLFPYDPFTSQADTSDLYEQTSPVDLLATLSHPAEVHKERETFGKASRVSPFLPVTRLCFTVSQCVTQLARSRRCICQGSHCESGSMRCGLNGTQSTVYLPISCDKVPDIDGDSIKAALLSFSRLNTAAVFMNRRARLFLGSGRRLER